MRCCSRGLSSKSKGYHEACHVCYSTGAYACYYFKMSCPAGHRISKGKALQIGIIDCLQAATLIKRLIERLKESTCGATLQHS
jgi:hypothetical protein